MKQKTFALTAILAFAVCLAGAPAMAQDSATYEGLHTRFAAERAAIHRGVWPERYVNWTTLPYNDDNLVEQHFKSLDYSHPDRVDYIPTGKVTGVARNANGDIEGVRVRLFNGKDVWIDQPDIRYDLGNQIVFTNIALADLQKMADEK